MTLKWAELAVLFGWWLQNGPQDFDFFQWPWTPIRLVCRYSYWRLGPNFCKWYYTKIVSFLYISLCSFCFCQQTVREWESAELYDYKDSSNNKKWILEKGIGLFSFSHICNSVCHLNLESKLSKWVFYNLKGLSLVSIYTEEIFTKIDLIKNILLKQWDKFVRIPFVQHNSQHLLGSFQT